LLVVQLRDVLEQRLSEVQSQHDQQLAQLSSDAKLVSNNQPRSFSTQIV